MVKVLSISSYGKLYNVAVHVWGCEERLLLFFLTKAFVLTSNVQAVFVALPGVRRLSWVCVCLGFFTAAAVSWMLQIFMHPFL